MINKKLIRVLYQICADKNDVYDFTLADYLNTEYTVNADYEIPYLAGYSKDGKTIYIDKRLPRWISNHLDEKETYPDLPHLPQILKDLITAYINGLVRHERSEKYFEDYKKYKYPYAHELATAEERKLVTSYGIDWDTYQNYMLKMVKKFKTFSGPLPPDIDTKPEKDTHDYYRYHKIKRLEGKE